MKPRNKKHPRTAKTTTNIHIKYKNSLHVKPVMCIMGDLLDPDPGGNKSPKMRQKMLKNFIKVFILFSGNFLPH